MENELLENVLDIVEVNDSMLDNGKDADKGEASSSTELCLDEGTSDKMSDSDIMIMIKFYEDSPSLWNANLTEYRNKDRKNVLKGKLAGQFNWKYSIETLDKKMNSLKTSVRNKVKQKLNESDNVSEEGDSARPKRPVKPWKFWSAFEFMRSEIEKEITREKEKKGSDFTQDEKVVLIEFYKNNPSLWNPLLKEYIDRDLRRLNFENLSKEFGEKYPPECISKEWHNLTTIYERERERHENSMKSGAGLEDVYNSKWPFYELLDFTKDRKTAAMKHKASPINQKRKIEEDFISPFEEAKIRNSQLPLREATYPSG